MIDKNSDFRNNTPHFIIIDDDAFNNFLCTALLHHLNPAITVSTFKDSDEAYKHLEQFSNSTSLSNVVILLDINLPRFEAWEFIEKFKKMSDAIHELTTLYIFTSAIDGRDKRKVASNPLIKGFIQKPMDKEVLEQIVASKTLHNAL